MSLPAPLNTGEGSRTHEAPSGFYPTHRCRACETSWRDAVAEKREYGYYQRAAKRSHCWICGRWGKRVNLVGLYGGI